MEKVEIAEIESPIDYWVTRPYLSETVRNSLTKSKVFLVPQERFRDRDTLVFPAGTEVFFNYLRENLPNDMSVEIAIDDDQYQEVCLHSTLLILGTIVVGGLTLIVCPIVVNVITGYINQCLFSERERKEATVRCEMTIVDGTKATQISYEGPAIEFKPEMLKAIAHLPQTTTLTAPISEGGENDSTE